MRIKTAEEILDAQLPEIAWTHIFGLLKLSRSTVETLATEMIETEVQKIGPYLKEEVVNELREKFLKEIEKQLNKEA